MTCSVSDDLVREEMKQRREIRFLQFEQIDKMLTLDMSRWDSRAHTFIVV